MSLSEYCRCCRPGAHWIPIIAALYLPIAFITTYLIALKNSHIGTGFAYISDTGATPPESCIFGQALAFGAVLCWLCIYIRYLHVCHLDPRITAYYSSISDGQNTAIRIKWLNRTSLVAGSVACIGLTVVGNFQATNVKGIHFFGAFLAFGVGVVYQILNTVIAFKVIFILGPRYVRYIRAVLSACSVCLAISLLAGDIAADKHYQGSDPRHWTWTEQDEGYWFHLVATASEWLMMATFCGYFSTFCHEFYRLTMHWMSVSEEDVPPSEEVVTQSEESTATIKETDRLHMSV